jgi:hypothetical protein
LKQVTPDSDEQSTLGRSSSGNHKSDEIDDGTALVEGELRGGKKALIPDFWKMMLLLAFGPVFYSVFFVSSLVLPIFVVMLLGFMLIFIDF